MMLSARTIYQAGTVILRASTSGGRRLRRRHQQRYSFSAAATITSISQILPHVEISTNPYDLKVHGRGESYHPTAPPAAVVMPTSIEDVVAIVRTCAEHRTPIIPYGAGTSVEGHVCALQEGSICMDMTLLNSIVIEENDGQGLPDPIATVGAGVTRKRLNEELR
jgi:D-lactate dehydrogenase (cytochrome)